MANKVRKKTVKYDTVVNGQFICPSCHKQVHSFNWTEEGWVICKCDNEDCAEECYLKPAEYEVISY